MLLPIAAGDCGRKNPYPDYYREPFPTASGKQIRIMDLHAGVVLLFFWTKDCAPCSSIEPEIQKAATLLKGKTAILGVNTDTGEPMDEAAPDGEESESTELPPPPRPGVHPEKSAHYQFDGPSLLDPEFQLVQELQVETAPALVVLHDTGKKIRIQRYYNLEKTDAKKLAAAIQKQLLKDE